MGKAGIQHDAHVVAATKIFRDVGFTLAAMEFPRSPESLAQLRAFNRVPVNWVEPVGWRYHPNRYLAERDIGRQND